MGVGSNVFNGVDDDHRSAIHKTAGLVGYLAATGITLPLSAFILFVRKIPDLSGMVLAVALSPLVALNKGRLYLSGSENPLPKNGDRVMSKFRALKDSLTPFGKLPEGTMINEAGSNENSNAAIMVKLMTLNIDTPTERLINALIEGYKAQYTKAYQQAEANNPEFFDSRECGELVRSVIQHYEPDCLCSRSEFEVTKSEITEVSEVIKTYMQSQETSLSVDKHLYKTPFEPSYQALFSGSKAIRSEEALYFQSMKA